MSNCIDFTKILPFCLDQEKGAEKLMKTPWLCSVKDQALVCLEQIKAEGRELRERDNDNPSDEFNNIIAFTGDRGTGKTTAMLAFKQYICAPQKGKEKEFFELPIVDPSRISDGESLLGTVVAFMFSEINEKAKAISSKERYEDRDRFRKIASQCTDVFRDIRIKSLSVKESMQEFSDDTDYLALFANAVTLRKLLYKLVKSYLNLMADKTECSGFLVIPIDDLDTNIVKGYAIAEEIHHFLMLPNVVLLMSVKMEQLSDIIEQKYISDYHKMLATEEILDAQPAEMAVKYLQKLIPMPQRVSLPVLQLHSLCNTHVSIENNRDNKDSATDENLVDYFLKLIYYKTGILLVKDENLGHSLIPLNLRALHHTFRLLGSLETLDWNHLEKRYPSDADSDRQATKEKEDKIKTEREKLKSNLSRVENWLVDSISSNAVPRELSNLFRMAAQHPIDGFCAFLAAKLGQYARNMSMKKNDPDAAGSYSRIFGDDPAVNNIFSAVQPQKTISVGDIFYLLDKMLEINSDEGHRHFVAAIHMLLSLRMTSLLYLSYSEEDLPEPDYQGAAHLLGDMIVNPAIRLTFSGNEWITNIDLTPWLLEVRESSENAKNNSKQMFFLNGYDTLASASTIKKDEQFIIPLQAVDWLCFFLVAPYQIAEKDLHKVRRHQEWLDRIPDFEITETGSSMPVFASFHWMRFATTILNPDESQQKLLWMVHNKQDGEGEETNAGHYLQAIKVYRDSKDELVKLPLPLHCMDFLHAFITRMKQHRWTNRMKTGDVYKTRDIDNFYQNMVDALKETIDASASCIAGTDKGKVLLENLETYPLFDWLQDKDASTTEDSNIIRRSLNRLESRHI